MWNTERRIALLLFVQFLDSSNDLESLRSQANNVVDVAILAPAQQASRPSAPTSDQEVIFELETPLLPAELSGYTPTEASARVAIAISRPGGATIGIAGPRGVGKTTIAKFQTTPRQDYAIIGAFIAAPVAYDVPLFLQSILKEVCLQILGSHFPIEQVVRQRKRSTASRRTAILSVSVALMIAGVFLLVAGISKSAASSPLLFGSVCICLALSAIVYMQIRVPPFRRWDRIAPKYSRDLYALDLLQRIDFTETLSLGEGIDLSLQGFSASRSRTRERTRRPITEVDVPRELGLLAANTSRPIVIAIDELDKFEDDSEAVSFLHRIKPLFGVANCSFIVSVSENAWTHFAHRGVTLWDAFDSAFDDVVWVQPLSARESRDLLVVKYPGITDYQALICHLLAGGVPRELLRAARQLSYWANKRADRALSRVLNDTLYFQLDEKVSAAAHRFRGEAEELRPLLEECIGWATHWNSGDLAERLRGLFTAHETGEIRIRRVTAPPALGDEGRKILGIANQVAVYVAVLLSIQDVGGMRSDWHRDGTSPEGEHPAVQGLASARYLVSSSPLEAMRHLHRARESLGLAALVAHS